MEIEEPSRQDKDLITRCCEELAQHPGYKPLMRELKARQLRTIVGTSKADLPAREGAYDMLRAIGSLEALIIEKLTGSVRRAPRDPQRPPGLRDTDITRG